MLRFKQMLEERSNGALQVEVYPNSQLGSDGEMLNFVQTGHLDFVYQTQGTQATIIPEAALFDTPFLLTTHDPEKVKAALIDSPFRTMFNEIYDQKGFKLLTLTTGTALNLSSNVPIRSMSDLQGLKIRTPQIESRMAIWRELGANPTPLPYSELYMALQQGLVDASDNVYSNMVSAKLVEQQKYIFPSNHAKPAMVLLTNKSKFDSLSAELQQIVLDAAKELNAMEFEEYAADDAKNLQIIKDEYKLEILEISDEFMEELKTKAAPAIQSGLKAVNNDALVQALEEALK